MARQRLGRGAVTLAGRMRDCLRGVDTLARLGGDEFVALLSDLTQKSDSEILVERLLEAIATPVELGELTLHMSGSIGLALYPQDTELTADLLLQQADQAMYRAKAKGRTAWHVFDLP
ncbi:diguanylate cyclase domain-containing protein [Ectothiorhodospira magna]|uniref:diguanylate cyclase domain-containing protein n=1 Tax=Ectothiorhodospira magna TaxID=867345 RepID=UPI00138FB884|nr:GGDEF domain-containing protein [Ectothiorhodospira magna]